MIIVVIGFNFRLITTAVVMLISCMVVVVYLKVCVCMREDVRVLVVLREGEACRICQQGKGRCR